MNIEKQPLLRFIVMGRKSLPDPSKKSRPYWSFVEMVTTNIEAVKTALKVGNPKWKFHLILKRSRVETWFKLKITCSGVYHLPNGELII